MDLDISQIIRRPVLSDKAYKLNKEQKQLVLLVHPKANKPLIADALRKLFDVVARKIRTSTRKGKTKRTRGKKSRTAPLRKIAFIELEEGYELNLFGQTHYDTGARNARRAHDSHTAITK